MISVLIPVFNTDVRNLVSALAEQIDPALHEIVVLDDGSDKDTLLINEKIAWIPGVKYSQSGFNSGRVSARNKLASLASHEWLLFLDADSGIFNDQFIYNYITSVGSVSAVIVGGRVYESSKPLLCEYVLHWKYGMVREGAWRREPDNIKGFQSSNFLIHRSIFEKIKFPEGIKGYGHEDTWMGVQLEKFNCEVKHIENAVYHLGLESADRYLQKSRQALENLVTLQHYCDRQMLARHVKILRKYMMMKRTGMIFMVTMFYRMFSRTIKRNLRSCNPDLFLFDIYRLKYLIGLMSSKH